MKTLKDVMTSHVHSIAPNTSIQTIAQKMKHLDVGAIPVIENKKILGVVTDRDIILRAVAEHWNLDQTFAKDVMTEDVIYCFEDDSLADAAQKMQEKQVRRLVVVDKNREVRGIVSLGDVAEKAPQKLSGKTLQKISEETGLLSSVLSASKMGLGIAMAGAGLFYMASKLAEDTKSNSSLRFERKRSQAA